jgi:hypothetical protein
VRIYLREKTVRRINRQRLAGDRIGFLSKMHLTCTRRLDGNKAEEYNTFLKKAPRFRLNWPTANRVIVNDCWHF